MNIKVGDRVRFLNSVGGGEVVRFINKNLVSVMEDDGFETPVLITECVVVESKQPSAPTQSTSTSSSYNRQPVEIPEAEEEPPAETKGGDILNIYLAYIPVEPKKIQETSYDCYLLNDSNYYLFFNLMSKTDNGWISRFHEVIEPNTKVFLEEIGKDQLNDIERINLQLLAFKKDKHYAQKNAISVNYKIDTIKFYKLHSFKENDFFDEDALIYPVVEKDIPYRSILVSPEDIETAIREKEKRPRVQPMQKKPKHAPIVEVDLHINQLLDNTNGLSNADMLNYQLEKVREIMDTYKNQKGQKIVFIHGKGEGVLRNAVIKEIQHKYKSVSVQDASFKEYGFGATLITIK